MGGLPNYVPDYDGDDLRDRPLSNAVKADGPTPEFMSATFAARQHIVVTESATILTRECPGLFVKVEVSLFTVYLYICICKRQIQELGRTKILPS